MTFRQRGGFPVIGHGWARAGTLLLAGLAMPVGLAACSSGGNGHAAGTTTTTGPQTGSSTGGRSTATTSGSSTSTTSSAASATTCQPAQLTATVGPPTGAAGTIALTIAFTNTSTTTCTLLGYPGMQLLDAHGGNLPTTVVRGQFRFPDATANQPPSRVTLAPQARATFSLAYEDVPVGNETSCPTSSQAEVTPPNDTTHLVVALQITPCGNGTVHVSPVYPT